MKSDDRLRAWKAPSTDFVNSEPARAAHGRTLTLYF